MTDDDNDGFDIIISELEKQLEFISENTFGPIIKPENIGIDARSKYFIIRGIKHRFIKHNSIMEIVKTGTEEHNVPGILLCADNFDSNNPKLTDRFVAMYIGDITHMVSKGDCHKIDEKNPNKKYSVCRIIQIPKYLMTKPKNKNVLFGQYDPAHTLIKYLQHALDFLCLPSHIVYEDITKDLSGQMISNFAAHIEKNHAVSFIKHKEHGFDILFSKKTFYCTNHEDNLNFNGVKYNPKTDMLISTNDFCIDGEQGKFMLVRINLNSATPFNSNPRTILDWKKHKIPYSNLTDQKNGYWGMVHVITFYNVESLRRKSGSDEFAMLYDSLLSNLNYAQ